MQEIRKLRILRISKYFIVVEDGAKIGSIHISEIGNGYIANLEKIFKPDDIVYGVRISENENFYSLKRGHNYTKRFIESGGGFFALQEFIEKFEKEK